MIQAFMFADTLVMIFNTEDDSEAPLSVAQRRQVFETRYMFDERRGDCYVDGEEHALSVYCSESELEKADIVEQPTWVLEQGENRIWSDLEREQGRDEERLIAAEHYGLDGRVCPVCHVVIEGELFDKHFVACEREGEIAYYAEMAEAHERDVASGEFARQMQLQEELLRAPWAAQDTQPLDLYSIELRERGIEMRRELEYLEGIYREE